MSKLLVLTVNVCGIQRVFCRLIDSEEAANLKASRDGTFGWTKYNSLAEIYTWLDDILAAYPTITESFIVGQSYEGRTIRGIKISYKSNNPGVLIESNIHAREWITSATATWLINEFLTSTDELVRDLAENHDWYIVPVLNVDGFVYTHEKVPMHSSILDTLLVKHIFCRIACGERPVNPPKFLVALEQTPIETTIRIGWRTRGLLRIPVLRITVDPSPFRSLKSRPCLSL